ncbi:acetyl-CoA carboxylase biotin carboxyl carrier protein [soil metagenome]
MTEESLAADARELVELIDRLEGLLEGSELTEIEVEAGGTALVLRTPAAIAEQRAAVAQPDAPGDTAGTPTGAAAPATASHHAVVAPLTGLFYLSPSPAAQAYVHEGGEVQVGQVIGLIEAMKLFNEIKSDVTGRIVRICVESGALVKAKQPLIEVEPA